MLKVRRIESVLNNVSNLESVINNIVVTNIPNQGRASVTMLEAAVIMREVDIVAYLLSKGADPNISTSGTSMVDQLIMGTQMYGIMPTECEQLIIDLLIQAGGGNGLGCPI